MKIRTGLCWLLLIASLCSYSQSPNSQIQDWINKGYDYLYTSKDSASHYFEKIYNASIAYEDLVNAMDALSLLNYTYGYHYDLASYGQILKRTDSLLTNYPNFLNENPTFIPYLYLDKANYLYKLQAYESSRVYLDSLLVHLGNKQRALTQDENELMDNAYSFYAAMYADEGKFDLARDYYLRNLRKHQSVKESDSLYPQILSTNNLIANLYAKEGNPKKANDYLLRSFDYYSKNKSAQFKNNRITTSFNIVRNYLNLKKADSAFYYLEKAHSFLPDNDPFWPNYYRLEGDVFKSKDSSNALKSYKTALELFEEKPNRFKTKEVSSTLLKISELYNDYSDYPKANVYADKALHYLKNNSQVKPSKNMAAIEYVNDKALYLEILRTKVGILFEQSEFEKVLEITESYVQSLDILRTSFETSTDKKWLLESSYPIFELGLDSAYELYQQDNNRIYLEKAFYLFEKSKGIRLLEAHYRSTARKYASIPEEILEKEKRLRSELLFLEKKLNESNSTETKDQIFKTKTDYLELLRDIEDRFPKYYSLTYQHEVSSLSSVEKKLRQNQAVVSYFYGNRNIYIIGVSDKKLSFDRTELNPQLIETLNQYKELLNTPKSSLTELHSKATELYSILLDPIHSVDSYEHITVVPDGLLNYLPFETLRNQKGYLLQNSSIDYAISITFLDQLDLKDGLKDALCFAPTFEGSNSNLPNLPHNEREASMVLSKFNGQSYIGSNSTIQNLYNRPHDYNIMHFATHAILDDANPEYSYLAFAPTDYSENRLFVADLYNMEFDTNLVTLSACHSGDGQLERGEGFLSLSRGFFYAGARSIVHSLWNINDASSAILMEIFYSHLAKGTDKSESLRLAKLEFIEKNKDNNLSHPYYWSAFMLNGNSEPLTSTNSTKYISVAVIILLLILIVFIMAKLKRR